MDFRQFIAQYYSFRGVWSLDLSVLALEYVEEEKIKASYVKNLFDEAGQQLYVFTDEGIWIFKGDTKEVEITVLKNYKVIKLEISQKRRDRHAGTKLKVHLESNEILNFDSRADSNEDWVGQYSELVKQIFDYLR